MSFHTHYKLQRNLGVSQGGCSITRVTVHAGSDLTLRLGGGISHPDSITAAKKTYKKPPNKVMLLITRCLFSPFDKNLLPMLDVCEFMLGKQTSLPFYVSRYGTTWSCRVSLLSLCIWQTMKWLCECSLNPQNTCRWQNSWTYLYYSKQSQTGFKHSKTSKHTKIDSSMHKITC